MADGESHGGPVGTSEGRPIRVLIVEDRPIARKLLQDELAEEGNMEVVGQARNGVEAVQAVKDLEPDVVIMDVVMPQLDGIGATRQIRQFSKVPIIILSGSHQDADTLRMMATKSGANDFILKPSGPVSVDLFSIRGRIIEAIHTAVATGH